MNQVLAAIALTTMMTSSGFAQPAIRYYNTIPSSRSPAITNDPSPHGYWSGDFLGGDPDVRINSELRRDPPDDR